MGQTSSGLSLLASSSRTAVAFPTTTSRKSPRSTSCFASGAVPTASLCKKRLTSTINSSLSQQCRCQAWPSMLFTTLLSQYRSVLVEGLEHWVFLCACYCDTFGGHVQL